MTPAELAQRDAEALVAAAKLEAAIEQEIREPTALEAINAFAGWLTTRPGTLKVGRERDASMFPELIGQFAATQYLEPIQDEHWVKRWKARVRARGEEQRKRAEGEIVTDRNGAGDGTTP